MSNKRDVDSTKNLNRCYNVVLQSSTKGTRAIDIAKQLRLHKTTVHKYLRTLEYMGKVENEQGICRVKKGEHTVQPIEKEIVIELPIPKDEWRRVVLLEHAARLFGENDPDNAFKISLQKLKETRTIRITGRNVDDLDLEKAGNLIKEACQRSSYFDIRNLFRKLTRQASKSSET